MINPVMTPSLWQGGLGARRGLSVIVIVVAEILYSQFANSAEIIEDEVVKEDSVYRIRFSARAEVSTAVLLSVLRDHARYVDLSPVIVRADVLRPEDNGLRLRLVLRPCVFGFCKNLRKVTDVTWLSENSVEYVGLPNRGDFETSHETITIGELQGVPGAAMFHYEADLVPGFFVPPVIGTWLISRQIGTELLGTLNGIEAAHSAGR